MKGKYDLWPKSWSAEPTPHPCAICLWVCSEGAGHILIEPGTRVCRCCFELLIDTAPDIARDRLAQIKQGDTTSV